MVPSFLVKTQVLKAVVTFDANPGKVVKHLRHSLSHVYCSS